MTILVDDDAQYGPGMISYRAPLANQEVDTSGYWGAAFRMENDVYNLWQGMTAPSFPPDPNFNFDAKAKVSQLFPIQPDAFIGVSSEAEWSQVEAKIAQELKDREILNASGWAGFGAQMTAGLLSPTILVPGGAVANAGRVTSAAGKAAAWSVLSTGLAETALQQSQLTRTGMETFGNIAGSAVLAGLLGGAIRWVDPLKINKMASGMVDNQRVGAILPHAAPSAIQPAPQKPLPPAAVLEVKKRFMDEVIFPLKDQIDEFTPITQELYDSLNPPVLKALGIESPKDLSDVLDFPEDFTPTTKQLENALRLQMSETAQRNYDAVSYDKPQLDEAAQEIALLKEVDEFTPEKALAMVKKEGADWLAFSKKEIENLVRLVGTFSDDVAGRVAARVVSNGDSDFATLATKPDFKPGDLEIYIRQSIQRAIEEEVKVAPPTPKEVWAESTYKGLSAQAVDDEESALFLDPGGFLNIVPEGIRERFPLTTLGLNNLGPITRGIGKGLTPTRRSVTAQFSSGGLHTQASAAGKAVAVEGDLESRVSQHLATFAMTNLEIKTLFRDWWLLKGGTPSGARFRNFFKGASYKQFLEETGDAIRMSLWGKSHPIEPVNIAAQLFLAKVYRPLIREAQALDIEPFNKMSPDFALQIVTNRVRPNLVASERLVAKAILKENALRVLTKGQYTLKDFVENGAEGKVFRVVEQRQDLDADADEIAEYILDKVLGNERRQGMYDVFVELGEKRAPFLYLDPFKVWSNGRTWNEFLNRDAESLARGFTRTMGPDVELYRTFGTNRPDIMENPKVPIWSNFRQELQAEQEKASLLPEKARKRRLLELEREAKEFSDDMGVLVGRLRHTWGMPEDPSAIGTRIGRYALQLNTMRLMGSVVISSVTDLARPIMKYGLLDTFRYGLLPLLTEFKTFRLLGKEGAYAGANLDVALHGRAGSMADLFEETEYGNWLDRAMQYGTSRIGLIALFDYWNAGLKTFSASIMQGKMLAAMEALANGKASKKQIAFLSQLNIDKLAAKKLWNQISVKGGGTEVKPGLWLPNTEDWSNISDEAIDALARVKAQEAIAQLDRDSRTKYKKPDAITKRKMADYEKPKLSEDGKKLKTPTAAQKKAYAVRLATQEKNLADAQTYGTDLTILAQIAEFKEFDDVVRDKGLNWPQGARTLEQKTALVRDVLEAAEVPRAKGEFARWAKEFREQNRVARASDRTSPEPTDKEVEAFKNDAWIDLNKEGKELQRLYRSAIKRSVEDTIVTPGLERPNWVDANTAGRLIAQFRSYTLASTFKVVTAAMQDAKLGNYGQVTIGAMMSLAFGMLSYYLWANTIGGEAKKRMERELDGAIAGDEDALGRWADEAIRRSGLLGVFGEGLALAERIPATTDMATFGDAVSSRSPFVNPVSEALGPTFGGLVNTLGRVVATADDPTSETFRKGKQLFPYQNHFIFRQTLDRLNEMAMDAAGVEYK